jgi:isopentenyl-diphosphate delta-isomerase
MKRMADDRHTLPDGEAPGQAEARKADHIDLAFSSQMPAAELDNRFFYEPLLHPHPLPGSLPTLDFLGKTLSIPIWVSSMTGGAQWAYDINTRLARACARFGMGMGLGSCRALLHSDEHLRDFDVRDLMGPDLPLFANLGIAQVELLLEQGATSLIRDMLDRLQADGLIIHLNPLQEWFQPEGDRIRKAPVHTIRRLLDLADYPLIVKEVGQGMGYQSLRFLLHMPLAAVDFGAAGGTNFSLLENSRRHDSRRMHWAPMVRVGHSADQMVDMVNQILAEAKGDLPCQQVIISGGVRHFLDGYYHMQRCQLTSVYGQASALLKYARESQEALETWIESQVAGLEMATAFLHINDQP